MKSAFAERTAEIAYRTDIAHQLTASTDVDGCRIQIQVIRTETTRKGQPQLAGLLINAIYLKGSKLIVWFISWIQLTYSH